MSVNLYLFRHGQTDMNIIHRYQGQLFNEKLNQKGIEQAEKLVSTLADYPLEVIYSSPLRRAYETAQILHKRRQIPLYIEYDLIEADHGIVEGLLQDEIAVKYPDKFKAWRSLEEDFIDCRFEKGESKREIRARILNALFKIASGGHKHIAVATHSMVLRCLLTHFGIRQLEIPNTQIIRISCENDQLNLIA